MNQHARSFVTRTFFLYFFIQCVPLDPKYYATIFSLPWSKLRYEDIFTLAHYTPRFFGTTPGFSDWAVVLLIALAAAAVLTYTRRHRAWATVEAEERHAARLQYWIRAIVRYRLAIALLAYGFIKLYPLQAPFPSLSNLNTPYGDFTRWKLFSLSLGVVPSYESFLGGVEIAAALFLLFRKTASIGALIVVFFTGNVLMSNISYEGGEYVYCAYLISLAMFVLAYDLERLANLLVFHRPAAPNTFRIDLSQPWQRRGRLVLKILVFFFFVVLLGFRTRWGYLHDPYQLPEKAGLTAARGLYNVSLFRLNHDTLPYSPTDSIRWKNVVFEPWATLSIAGNHPADIDPANGEDLTARTDADKTYELEGTNGRSYYNYEFDTTAHSLTLRNKNGRDSADQWLLHYARPDSSHIILSGLGPHRDSVYVVLDRIDKKYLLEEAARSGRTKTLKL
jgi:hypothetical protein